MLLSGLKFGSKIKLQPSTEKAKQTQMLNLKKIKETAKNKLGDSYMSHSCLSDVKDVTMKPSEAYKKAISKVHSIWKRLGI